MFALFLLMLMCACLLCVISNRHSLAAILFIGFAQDPFRKLVVGEPIAFIVMVGVVFAVVLVMIGNRVGVARFSQPFVGWTATTRAPLAIFMLILTAQFLHSYLRYGNTLVSLIGLISYLAPFLAIVVGYFSVNGIEDIRRFMKLYVVAGSVVAVTVLMSFTGTDWPVFREIGAGLKIYDQGTVLRSFSGLMRTGEIAAWHMATSACFFVILFFTSARRNSTLVVAAIVAIILLAVTLTGRRKMLMLFTVFGLMYIVTYFYYRKTLSIKYVLMASAIVIVGWGVVEFLIPGGYGDTFNDYLARGTSVYTDASGRMLQMGLQPVSWAVNRVGLLGGGLGIASQGSHLFNVASIAGGSGEGGLGKVMVELGLPGLVATLWVIIAFAVYVGRSIKLSAQRFVPPYVMPLMLGIATILFVNVLTFSVATQVYGDVFILLLLGLMAGFLLALPKLVIHAMNENSQRNSVNTMHRLAY